MKVTWKGLGSPVEVGICIATPDGEEKSVRVLVTERDIELYSSAPSEWLDLVGANEGCIPASIASHDYDVQGFTKICK